MEAPRHIGIDLHRNQFTCCMRIENGRNYLTEWKLEDLPRFVKKLRPNDEIAVEVTGNTRLFYDAVAPHVARVVAVDPNQFKVISHSVKKTDPNDARNLALYLDKDLLPEVRMKDKTQAQLASLAQTRDTLVKLRTSLKNKVNNILSAHGFGARGNWPADTLQNRPTPSDLKPPGGMATMKTSSCPMPGRGPAQSAGGGFGRTRE